MARLTCEHAAHGAVHTIASLFRHFDKLEYIKYILPREHFLHPGYFEILPGNSVAAKPKT